MKYGSETIVTKFFLNEKNKNDMLHYSQTISKIKRFPQVQIISIKNEIRKQRYHHNQDEIHSIYMNQKDMHGG